MMRNCQLGSSFQARVMHVVNGLFIRGRGGIVGDRKGKVKRNAETSCKCFSYDNFAVKFDTDHVLLTGGCEIRRVVSLVPHCCCRARVPEL